MFITFFIMDAEYRVDSGLKNENYSEACDEKLVFSDLEVPFNTTVDFMRRKTPNLKNNKISFLFISTSSRIKIICAELERHGLKYFRTSPPPSKTLFRKEEKLTISFSPNPALPMVKNF